MSLRVEEACGARHIRRKRVHRIVITLNNCGEGASKHRTALDRTFTPSPQKNERLTLQLQHARFLSENRLCGVAQLVDLLCREQEGTVLGRLPSPRVEQFAEDELLCFCVMR